MEIKENNFDTIYFTKSDEHGDYKIDLPAGIYPFVTAVRDYGEKYLEYWCSNLKLIHDTQLNICIDTLEVYGLNYFKVAGAYPSITVYFRPMSLPKFLAQAEDIAPEEYERISHPNRRTRGRPQLEQIRLGNYRLRRQLWSGIYLSLLMSTGRA